MISSTRVLAAYKKAYALPQLLKTCCRSIETQTLAQLGVFGAKLVRK